MDDDHHQRLIKHSTSSTIYQLYHTEMNHVLVIRTIPEQEKENDDTFLNLSLCQ